MIAPLRVLAAAVLAASLCACTTPGAGTRVTRAAYAPAEVVVAPGRVTVLAFYATWCPAARKMLRAVTDLAHADGKRDVLVVGVAEDADDGAAAAEYARSVGFEGKIMVDAGGDLARRLELETVPALVVIGQDGTVQRIHAGYRGEETLATVEREAAALTTKHRSTVAVLR